MEMRVLEALRIYEATLCGCGLGGGKWTWQFLLVRQGLRGEKWR